MRLKELLSAGGGHEFLRVLSESSCQACSVWAGNDGGEVVAVQNPDSFLHDVTVSLTPFRGGVVVPLEYGEALLSDELAFLETQGVIASCYLFPRRIF